MLNNSHVCSLTHWHWLELKFFVSRACELDKIYSFHTHTHLSLKAIYTRFQHLFLHCGRSSVLNTELCLVSLPPILICTWSLLFQCIYFLACCLCQEFAVYCPDFSPVGVFSGHRPLGRAAGEIFLFWLQPLLAGDCLSILDHHYLILVDHCVFFADWRVKIVFPCGLSIVVSEGLT